MRTLPTWHRGLPAIAAALLLAAAPAGGVQEVEPVSLADWSGDPPGVVADDHRFELIRVSAEFTSRHGMHHRSPVGGARLRIEGWVSPPDPRAIMGGRATLTLDGIVDASGRDLIAGPLAIEPSQSLRQFRRGAAGSRRPGFHVRADVPGCREVPAAIRSLRGRIAFAVPDTIATATVPLEIGDELVEVHPGLSVRVTEVHRATDDARVVLDYALRNADDGYDREQPPYLLDVRMVDGGGDGPRHQSWTTSGGRNVILHTGLHGTIRVTGRIDEGVPLDRVAIEVITAVRSVEIPFHFTDLALSVTAPDDPIDQAALPAYEPEQVPAMCVVEHDDVLLSLTKLSSTHGVTFRDEAIPTSAITGDLTLRLPRGTWSHARMPIITGIADHVGAPVDFEQNALPATPDFNWYRTIENPGVLDVRASFDCRHERPPLAGLSALRGTLPVRRASRIETIELPWAALDEAEVLPGLRVALEAPGGDAASPAIAWKFVSGSSRGTGMARLPYVVNMEIVAADGTPLRTQRQSLGTDELDDRTIHRGRLEARKLPEGVEPAVIVCRVVTEVEDLAVDFAFEDLPFRVE